MKLVDDAKQAWRWFSMQAMSLAVAVQGTWVLIPDDMRATIPHSAVQWITIILLIAGIVGRFIDQKKAPQ